MKDIAYQCLRILLIEDNADDALLIRSALSALRDEKYTTCELIHVIHVSRLRAALQRLAKGGIDVILSDLLPPDSEGGPAFSLLRAQAPTVPLVVLTRQEDELSELKAKRDGVYEFLYKDRLDGCSLSETLRGAIEQQRVKVTLEQLKHQLCPQTH